ncbi:unnamed protein product, partial [Allacma fusca]
DCEAVVSNLEQ